jgi:amino acid transporter
LEVPVTTTRQDDLLKRRMGLWSLVATGLGSVIGSGWLFSSLYAAQTAGPASILAWLIGGVLMLLIALVFAELGMVKPESGGVVRYPLYSNGTLAASIVGWCMWVTYVANPPTEAAGVVQYASAYLPGVFAKGQLTWLGVLLAVVLMAVFVVINYFGVRLFARTNNVVTAVKVLIPTTTVVMLIASGFQGGNFSAHGVAPYGWGAALGTIATAGMVFAYTGFRNIVELSGEAVNPRRTIPQSLIITIGATIVLYVGLEVAFLGAVPGKLLGHGWHGVNLDSPFAQLAMMLNITWLYWVLIADSMLSPSGAAIVFTGANARNVFGLAKNGFFPAWSAKVHDRWGIPTRALLLNFVVGVVFLLPLPSWHKIIGITGTLLSFTFAIGSVTLLAFRRVGITGPRLRLPGMQVFAPAAFAVASLVIFWVPWGTLLKTVPIIAISLVLFVVNYARRHESVAELKGGAWLVFYLVVMFVLALLGPYGGLGVLPEPWGSIVVAVVAVAMYFWGVRAAVTYLRHRPARVGELRDEADRDRELATVR